MGSLLGKKIVLGVTGGIAAYKSPDLVRRLREQGAEVQVVMTAGARQFVTPITFQAVSGREVRDDLWDPAGEAAMGHIELARWADLVLVAPATADFIARLASGRAEAAVPGGLRECHERLQPRHRLPRCRIPVGKCYDSPRRRGPPDPRHRDRADDIDHGVLGGPRDCGVSRWNSDRSALAILRWARQAEVSFAVPSRWS